MLKALGSEHRPPLTAHWLALSEGLLHHWANPADTWRGRTKVVDRDRWK